MQKREIDVVVLSDLHLGTFASRAVEILAYLKSIQPRLLILNGDIIDIWQFSKRYFPSSHMAVIQEIVSILGTGTRVIYITGNHDELLRRYSPMNLGNFQLTDKLVIEINNRMTWIFHGDVFDHTSSGQAKFWGKLGSNGYAMLLGFNKFINAMLKLAGREKVSFSRRVMNHFHKNITRVDAFEQMVAEVAIEKKYDCVICGHIHQPQHRIIATAAGTVTYLNAGDWVENLTSLEYYGDGWHLYTYDEKDMKPVQTKMPKQKTNVMTHETSIPLLVGNLGRTAASQR